MRTVLLVLLLTGCASNTPPCTRFGCPQTPIGDYTGWGKCQPGQCAQSEPTQTYRCAEGGTEIIRRGAKNPDPQTCKPVERI